MMTDKLDAKALLEGTTPGPWHIEDPFDFDLSIGVFIAGCKLSDEEDHDLTGRQVQANARLIAAAPDLARRVIELEAQITALRERVAELEGVGRKWLAYHDLDEADFAMYSPMLRYAEAIEATRAALRATMKDQADD